MLSIASPWGGDIVEAAPMPKEWTFMVYLDGDNNLEENAVDDFLEMASVGSHQYRGSARPGRRL